MNQDNPPELPPRPPTLLSLSPRAQAGVHPSPPPPPPAPALPAPHAPAYQSPSSASPPSQTGVVVGSSVNHTCQSSPWYSIFFQKYVLLTIISGSLSIILGSLFITIYFVVRNTTTSLHYFETLPTYIPGIAMILTGLMVTLFSKTSHRKSILVKICGCLCLLSALLCVVVTVTTTVVHMNRLQTLRECVYQSSTKTCTCFAGIMDHRSLDHDAALRYVFAAAPNCEVIHGTIYTCLRAMFGLSVIGILISIFSCMLVYQILSHEKKKKYLAELNVRCRSLYQRPGLAQSSMSHYSSANMCQYPWLSSNRLCSGNLYTPTPELSISTISTTLSSGAGQTRGETSATTAPTPGSSGAGAWRWLPWSRKHVTQTGNGIAHSQSDAGQLRSRGQTQQSAPARPPHWRYSHSDAIYGFRPPTSTSLASTMSSYNMGGQYGGRLDLTNIDSLSNLLWGPPPPYSQPSSSSEVSSGDTCPQHPVNNDTSGGESPARSGSRLSRTTKSGILIEKEDNTGDNHDTAAIHYDETVDSAMHIYEKLRRSRSGSLPSRRVKKNRKINPGTSASNLITSEVVTPAHLNQNLSALNLSRAEELRTAKDLEQIKRALIALQKNSLGILGNIQSQQQQQAGNSVYPNNSESRDFQQRKENVPINSGLSKSNSPVKGTKKGLSSVSHDQLVPVRGGHGHGNKFSWTQGTRKTISTTNLVSSDSEHSYGQVSGSIISRASSSVSSPTPPAVNQLSPYLLNQMQTKTKTPAASVSSPVSMMTSDHGNTILAQHSLSGLLSPRHLNMGHSKDSGAVSARESGSHSTPAGSRTRVHHHQSPPAVSHQLSGLISPARMYPSNFSPLKSVSPPSLSTKSVSPPSLSNKSISTPVSLPGCKSSSPPSLGVKPGLVYLRQDQNIPENFCDKFRPIQPASSDEGVRTSDTNQAAADGVDIKNISSDDIVVTLHSVNV